MNNLGDLGFIYTFISTMLAGISSIGLVTFIIYIVIDIILFKIHQLLGLLGLAFIVAKVMGWI